MEVIKKIQRDEGIQSALLNLDIGDTLEVPFKMYSASTIRAIASQLKSQRGCIYEVNTRGEKNALIKRVG